MKEQKNITATTTSIDQILDGQKVDCAWSLRLHPPFTNYANFKAFNVFDFYHQIYFNIEKSIQIINCMFVRMGQIQIYDSRTYVS